MRRDHEPINNNSRNRLKISIATALLGVLALSGCASDNNDSAPKPTITTSVDSSPSPSPSDSITEVSPSQTPSPTESKIQITGSYTEAKQYLLAMTPDLKNSEIWDSLDSGSAEFFTKNNISLPLLVDTANFTAELSEYIKSNPDTTQDVSLRDIDYQTYHSIAVILNKAATNPTITSKLSSQENTLNTQVASLANKDMANVYFAWKVASPNLYDAALPKQNSITSQEILSTYPVEKGAVAPEFTRILRTFAAYSMSRSGLLNDFSIDTYLSPNS
jgi:outer membrane murein-binding lipoprotein Lpp